MLRRSAAVPSSPEAEQAFLGMALRDPRILDDFLDRLEAEHFHVPIHRRIYEVMRELFQARAPVDIISVADHLRVQSGAGGEEIAILADLMEAAPVSQSPAHLASILMRDRVLRIAVDVARTLQQAVETYKGAAESFVDEAETLFSRLRSTVKEGKVHSIVESLDATFALIEAAAAQGTDVTGVPTGFTQLDRLTGGLQPGHLIIMAARPGMGKTAIALNLAVNAYLGGSRVLVFSIEMTKEEITTRMLSAVGQVNGSRIKTGNLAEDEFDRIALAARQLGERHPGFGLADSPHLNLAELRGRCRRFKNQVGLDLVVVDYLQLMTPAPGQSFDSHALAIGSISRGLKELAKELKIPVVALAQLNRNLESRATQRPKASDLKDSSSLEADADLVLLIYRDEVVNPNTDSPGIAELIVGKNRHGPMTTIRLAYHADTLKFSNMLEDE